MNRLWQKFSLKQFKLFSVVALFAGDLALCVYIYFKMAEGFNSPNLLMAMQQIMGNLAQNDPETAALLSASFQDPVFIKEIASKGLAALKTVIVVALCFQALFYFLYYRKAIVAYYYIYLVAFGGVLADLLLIFTSSNTLPLYYYFFIQVLLYFVVILGLFHYGDQYKKERWAAKMAKYNTPA